MQMKNQLKEKFKRFFVHVKESAFNTAFGVTLAFSAAKFETILNIVLFTLEQFPAIITAFALRMIIDSCLSTESIYLNASIWVMCYIAALLVSKGVGSMSGVLVVSLRKKFERYLDQKILKRVLDSGISFFDDPANMDSLRIVQNESGVINSVVFVGLRTFSVCIALITSVVILSALSPWMTVLYILAVIPAVISNSKFNFLIWEYDFTHSRDYRRSDNIYSEMTDQNKAIEFRLYNNFPRFRREYCELRENWISEKNKMFKQYAWKLFFSYLLQTLALICVFALSIVRYAMLAITVGDVQFYVNTALSIKNSVMDFFDNITSIAIYSDKVGKLKTFLNVRDMVDTKESGLRVPHDFKIEFRDVGFRYPGSDTWVLKNCSFAFERGDKVAFVGLNGAGKSTAIKLLLGLYPVTEGSILLNGVPIDKYKRSEFYQLFGAMFQDVIIYSMSIRENITIGSHEPEDDEKLMEACDIAGLTGMISGLPKGMDTELQRTFESDGLVPSGGQAQRIALARAIYRGGEIMILDEPVASIDPETEFEIFAKVKKEWKGKTLVLVSHRLSNVTMCDKIIVIEDGKADEIGTHSALMKSGGAYARMYATQAEKYMSNK